MASLDADLERCIAKQLLVDLERYERAFEELVTRPWALELSFDLAELADVVCRSRGQLPGTTVAFARFVISRAELASEIWRASSGGSATHGIGEESVHSHRHAIRRLAQVCVAISAGTPSLLKGTPELLPGTSFR